MRKGSIRWHSRGHSLYLLPESAAAQRPNLLLAQGMGGRRKWAVGRVAMSGHRQTVFVRPLGRILAMDVLRDQGRHHHLFDKEPQISNKTF